jgi:hypothetical protein
MQEGVIQYQLIYQPLPPNPTWPCVTIDAVRQQLRQRGGIGQDPQRYGGLGFGNISCRHGAGFIISGSQTGHLPTLQPTHFAFVEEADVPHNRLRASGPCQPSSEALSHAACYALSARVGAVIHVHDPALWQLNALPATPANITYGTVAMAKAVAELFANDTTRGIFRMAGHEDGVMAFAPDLEQALQLILDCHQQMP